MSQLQKYDPPEGPPPSFQKPVHEDAGPYYGSMSQSPAPYNNQQEQFRGYGSPPPQGQWNQQPQQQYGPPQGGYYQPQQQGPMYYGQQPYGQPQYGQPQGYYGNRSSGAGEGICAGIMAALACCCCMDFLF